MTDTALSTAVHFDLDLTNPDMERLARLVALEVDDATRTLQERVKRLKAAVGNLKVSSAVVPRNP